jgi:hypothetical protein
MLADVHVHYPMRVVNDLTPETAVEQIRNGNELASPGGVFFGDGGRDVL